MKLILPFALLTFGISSSLWSMNTENSPQRLLMVRVADLMNKNTKASTLKKSSSLISNVPRSTSPVEVEHIVEEFTHIAHDKFILVDVAHMSQQEKENYFSLPGNKICNAAAGNSPLCFIAKPNTTAIQPLKI